jgi:hypothetical protein
LVSSFVASWFETREDALLTMREGRPHPEDPTEKSVDEMKIQGRHCEERSDEQSPLQRAKDGLLGGACHRAALCADPLARNDG